MSAAPRGQLGAVRQCSRRTPGLLLLRLQCSRSRTKVARPPAKWCCGAVSLHVGQCRFLQVRDLALRLRVFNSFNAFLGVCNDQTHSTHNQAVLAVAICQAAQQGSLV